MYNKVDDIVDDNVHLTLDYRQYTDKDPINPETISTDYDEADRLYFENIAIETILDSEYHRLYSSSRPSFTNNLRQSMSWKAASAPSAPWVAKRPTTLLSLSCVLESRSWELPRR